MFVPVSPVPVTGTSSVLSLTKSFLLALRLGADPPATLLATKSLSVAVAWPRMSLTSVAVARRCRCWSSSRRCCHR